MVFPFWGRFKGVNDHVPEDPWTEAGDQFLTEGLYLSNTWQCLFPELIYGLK